MKYGDLRPAITAFAVGQNVSAALRKARGVNSNTDEIVEIAYDLQAGSYIKYARENVEHLENYASEIAGLLSPQLSDGDRLLEVGTGEMTTLVAVANKLEKKVDHYALDISWSRISVGRQYVDLHTESTVHSFVGDLFHLPFLDKSIDVIWSSHALEPNGGREIEAIAELFRVARKYVVLFEPSYEDNSATGRDRMDALGYVKGLRESIAQAGGSLHPKSRAMVFKSNPLNPTFAHIVGLPPSTMTRSESPWACPATQFALTRRNDCFWSEESRLAYPIIGGIPVLRPEAAVLATSM